MLERRIVIARLGQEKIEIETTKGYHLLIELEQQGYKVLSFADDLVIIVSGKVDSLISDRLQFALNYMQQSGVGGQNLTSTCTEKKIVNP
jgi:hypothetical protein